MVEPSSDSATPAEADTPSRTAASFQEFASTWEGRAPLYAALAAGIARDPSLHRLLLHAPETQQLPVLLFASVHDLLLARPLDELAEWYPNITDPHRAPDDPRLLPAFGSFVAAHRPALVDRLTSRTIQTNEVGRCSWFVLAMGLLAREVGPLGHLDVGTSAGLTLLLDRYEYRFRFGHGVSPDGPSETVVGGPSPVVLATSLRGDVPVPERPPAITTSIGIDRSPIDVGNDDEARWLEACVWPDHEDRFHRLEAAIGLARRSRPTIWTGDALEMLARGVTEVGRSGHPVVTNSWVLNYLTAHERIAYLDELDRIGAGRDLSWIFAEAPALVPELPAEPDPANPHLTVLTVARWRDGTRSVETLATCHPHGFWIHWR